MKTRFLSFFTCICLASLAVAQVSVPIANYSFEEPANGLKISNGQVPGWSMDTIKDSGREANSAIDGFMAGYTTNEDGSLYQAVDVIADANITYVLTYYGQISWTPEGNDSSYFISKYSAFSGADPTTRVVLDSQAVLVKRDQMGNWQQFTYTFEILAGSANIDDSLVIEINMGTEQPLASWIRFDKVQLTKYTEGEVAVYPIANMLDGTNHTDAADFTGNLSATWDADSIYMQIVVADDSIVNVGNNYQVDNIEIYFDMDNSKNIHWPRNGGWIASDPTFDTNDYQLRVVAGIAGIVTPDNAQLEGANVMYAVTDTGYNWNINIPWNSLLDGFVPEVGKVIGFDMDASDNDNGPFYRDQFTLNSPTVQIFNDPSLWANVQLGAYGQFIGLPQDETPPSVPTGLDSVLTDTNKINLKWTPSTDQASAVMQYAIYMGDVLRASIYPANATTATYNVTGLETETAYTFKVVAIDNYGNESAASASKTISTKAAPITPPPSGFNNVELSFNKIYPNPSTGIFNIVTSDKGLVSFNVYNVTGELVKSGNFTDSYRLDLSDYSNGMYILNVKSAQKSEVVRLIIK